LKLITGLINNNNRFKVKFKVRGGLIIVGRAGVKEESLLLILIIKELSSGVKGSVLLKERAFLAGGSESFIIQAIFSRSTYRFL
jgi:hypothetical protein